MILGEPVVFLSDARRRPRCIGEPLRAPHLPLSMGKLIGDELQCRYHGCATIRAGAASDSRPGHCPAKRARESYPLVERYRWLWIWMGDPALADPAKIIDFHWLDDRRWGAKASYLHVKANWQLIVDNLLDLTHLAFVHENDIGTTALAEHAAVKLSRNGDNILLTRWIIDHRRRRPSCISTASRAMWTAGRSLILCPPRSCASMWARLRQVRGRRRPAYRRHHHAQSQRHNAGDRDHLALFLGQAHDFDHDNPAVTERILSRFKPLSSRTSRC
jgi:vanillate O-demethylase monooxygenase subunit